MHRTLLRTLGALAALALAGLGCSGETAPASSTAAPKVARVAAALTAQGGAHTLVTGLGGPDDLGTLDLVAARPPDMGGLDDGAWKVDVSTVFPDGLDFFGTKYDAAQGFFVGTNGYVTFGQPSTSYSPGGIALSRLPIVAGFYADADFRIGGKLYVDLDPDPADPVVTLTYWQAPQYGTDGTARNSYQIRLHRMTLDPTNGDGVAIELRYAQIEWTYLDRATAGWADGGATGGSGAFGTVPSSVSAQIVYSGTADIVKNATDDPAATNLDPPLAGVYLWQPATVTVTSGSGQSARISTAFAAPLAVQVTDSAGQPIPGATVSFRAPGSGASATLGAASALADAAGACNVTAAANATGGSYAVTAFASGTYFSPRATFSLTNTVPVPAAVSVTSGGGQSAVVGQPFALPLVAHVLDTDGQPMPGVTVRFAAPGAGASATLSAATAVTNGAGDAAITATAGTTAGAFQVAATVDGVATPATFALSSRAGSPARIAAVSGTPQPGMVLTPYAAPLVAVVRDAFGNVVPGATVRFSASGANGDPAGAALSPAQAVTGPDGRASARATADGVGGTVLVVASVQGVSSSTGFWLTQVRLASHTTLSVPAAPARPGEAVTLSGTVYSPDGSGPTPTGSVVIHASAPLQLADGTSARDLTAPLTQGRYAVPVLAPASDVTLSAEYQPDAQGTFYPSPSPAVVLPKAVAADPTPTPTPTATPSPAPATQSCSVVPGRPSSSPLLLLAGLALLIRRRARR